MSETAHGFRRGQAGQDRVRSGELSERFELRNGDCAGSDCEGLRSRSEINLVDAPNPARVGQDTWYGYSFQNVSVPGFDQSDSLRLVFGQWLHRDLKRPIFRFIQLGEGETKFENCDPAVCHPSPSATADLAVQLTDIAKAQEWDTSRNKGYVCKLFNLEASRGQWRDIVINTNFGTDEIGYLRIWVDDGLVCDYRGPLVADLGIDRNTPIGHRRGIYSPFTKRWRESTKGSPHPAFIVYYDEFAIGNTRTDVDPRQRAAFGQPAAD
ncbi:MAG: polysaccharide lyase [Marinovum sp.]|nr:polysaccharide lyase [Marinovum sp.]